MGYPLMEYSLPEAKVIADSISDAGHRLTTVEVKLHRFVLAELNTHRVFSRNSASSRAIPAQKLRQMAMGDPAMPLWWGKNQSGMQAPEELGGDTKLLCMSRWLEMRNEAVNYHESLELLGLHKQVVNRLLEPFLWHRVIISATEWDNFFHQRCHKDAQPEMRAAAEAIYVARQASEPTLLKNGQWHRPYFSGPHSETLSVMELNAISVARCARVSYLTHDGIRDPQADIALFSKLAQQVPGHWSPMEHVATPRAYGNRGNFIGWRQLRHDIEGHTGKYKESGK